MRNVTDIKIFRLQWIYNSNKNLNSRSSDDFIVIKNLWMIRFKVKEEFRKPILTSVTTVGVVLKDRRNVNKSFTSNSLVFFYTRKGVKSKDYIW